jgi:hypothetical protein
MLLREHPLFRYHGMLSWPPVWTWMGGGNDKRPRGEVGILRRVEKSNVPRTDRCFLFIDYEGSSYIGCLLFSDHVFCSQIVRNFAGSPKQDHRSDWQLGHQSSFIIPIACFLLREAVSKILAQ